MNPQTCSHPAPQKHPADCDTAEDLAPIPSTAYRFWVVHPGEHVLRSPYDAPIVWTGPSFAAVCTVDPQHRPPAAGCECGTYADPTLDILRHREKVWRSTLPARLATVTSVLGRVELTDAVPFSYRPPALALIAPGRTWPDELRAASARITELTILDNAALTAEEIGTLCGHLAEVYGCPVTWARE